MPESMPRNVVHGEIVLNGVKFRTVGDVTFDIANNYERQASQGDPGPQDHAVDSQISQEDWTGGINVKLQRGDEDRGNSWFSTLWMQTRNMLTLHPKTLEVTVDGEDGNVWVHEKLDGTQYITFGQQMKRWIEATDSVADPASGADSSTGTPSGPGVIWGPAGASKKLFIPMSTDPYETWDGTNFSPHASEESISFVVWQEKLFKIDSAGTVKFTTDGTTWDTKGQISNDHSPNILFLNKDAVGEDVVAVSTTAGVFNLDFVNEWLIETDFHYPEAPFQGKAAARWRSLTYFSVGLGIHRLFEGLVQAVGPDGKDGLPKEYSQGEVVHMEPSYNELLVAINGNENEASASPDTSDLEMGLPDGMYAEILDRFSLVLGQNGLGWHVKWAGVRNLTNIHVSSNSGVYRYFWGSEGALYTQPAPIGYYNPRYLQQSVPLERYGRHITPFYNWGFLDTPKILKFFETKTLNCDDNNYIKVWMRMDEEEEWGDGSGETNPLAIINTNGQHLIEVGFETILGNRYHVGLNHEKVQFMFEFFGDAADDYSSPIMEWFTVIGRKWMRAVRIFSAQIDSTEKYADLSPRKQGDVILAAARKKGGVPLIIGDESFVVEVTTDSGNLEAGMTYKAYHNITMVDIHELATDE